MQVYLVGGAVRDELLGLPVHERDWCVVGATPDEMKNRGYRQVGKDFPVFLHPDSGEEYALARTERKTARGYRGFAFDYAPDVTIEDDLLRRDLTINAIARSEDGDIVDPYGGVDDLESRLLRHVSDAFREDPVRVLRVARFAARFEQLGFRIADETASLMREIVDSGEVDALVPDRVWKETETALAGSNTRTFFETLRACGALAVIYPEVDALFGVPQPEKWHPEIDTGVHTMMVLEQCEKLSDDVDVRFACLVHDLGKGTTPEYRWPSHPGHEKRGSELIRSLCRRLPVPRAFRELGIIVAERHTHCHRAYELRADTVLKLLEKTDAFRRPARFEKFLLACEADARGRTGLEDRSYPQADYLRGALAAASGIDAAGVARAVSPGRAADSIRRARIRSIADYASSAQDPP